MSEDGDEARYSDAALAYAMSLADNDLKPRAGGDFRNNSGGFIAKDAFLEVAGQYPRPGPALEEQGQMAYGAAGYRQPTLSGHQSPYTYQQQGFQQDRHYAYTPGSGQRVPANFPGASHQMMGSSHHHPAYALQQQQKHQSGHASPHGAMPGAYQHHPPPGSGARPSYTGIPPPHPNSAGRPHHPQQQQQQQKAQQYAPNHGGGGTLNAGDNTSRSGMLSPSTLYTLHCDAQDPAERIRTWVQTASSPLETVTPSTPNLVPKLLRPDADLVADAQRAVEELSRLMMKSQTTTSSSINKNCSLAAGPEPPNNKNNDESEPSPKGSAGAPANNAIHGQDQEQKRVAERALAAAEDSTMSLARVQMQLEEQHHATLNKDAMIEDLRRELMQVLLSRAVCIRKPRLHY